MITWNSEYKSGNSRTQKIFVDLIKKMNPSLIAICQQEATKNKAKDRTLGALILPELKSYRLLEEHKIKGITKVLKGNNFTNITVLAENRFAIQRIISGSVSSGHHRVDAIKRTKGVTWINLSLRKSKANLKKLIVACAHLDASKIKLRSKGLVQVSSALSKLNPDNVVIAGDFNYRTYPLFLGRSQTPQSIKGGGVSKEPQHADEMTVGSFIDNFLSKGRSGFNVLNKASLSFLEFERLGYDCDGFNDGKITAVSYPPTYKMSYKSEEDRQSCARYTQTLRLKSTEQGLKNYARDCYFKGLSFNDSVPKKMGELNIGYLDNICTRGNGVEKIKQGSLPIFESDHLPVWSLIRLKLLP